MKPPMLNRMAQPQRTREDEETEFYARRVASAPGVNQPHPAGIVTLDREVSPEEMERARSEWERRQQAPSRHVNGTTTPGR